MAQAVGGNTREEMADTDLGDGACRDSMARDGCARLSKIVVERQVVEVARSENVERALKSLSIFRAPDSLNCWFHSVHVGSPTTSEGDF